MIAEYLFAENRFGCDLLLMYARHGKNVGYLPDRDMSGPGTQVAFTRDNIDVPVNFILKATRSDLLNPYLFTGPMIGFNIADNKKPDIDINLFFLMEFWSRD